MSEVYTDPDSLISLKLKHLQCTICTEFMDERVLHCANGHIWCFNCMDKFHGVDRSYCHLCGQEYPLSSINLKLFSDIKANGLVKCPRRGCNVRIQFNKINTLGLDHYNKRCKRRPFLCPWHKDNFKKSHVHPRTVNSAPSINRRNRKRSRNSVDIFMRGNAKSKSWKCSASFSGNHIFGDICRHLQMAHPQFREKITKFNPSAKLTFRGRDTRDYPSRQDDTKPNHVRIATSYSQIIAPNDHHCSGSKNDVRVNDSQLKFANQTFGLEKWVELSLHHKEYTLNANSYQILNLTQRNSSLNIDIPRINVESPSMKLVYLCRSFATRGSCYMELSKLGDRFIMSVCEFDDDDNNVTLDVSPEPSINRDCIWNVNYALRFGECKSVNRSVSTHSVNVTRWPDKDVNVVVFDVRLIKKYKLFDLNITLGIKSDIPVRDVHRKINILDYITEGVANRRRFANMTTTIEKELRQRGKSNGSRKCRSETKRKRVNPSPPELSSQTRCDLTTHKNGRNSVEISLI